MSLFARAHAGRCTPGGICLHRPRLAFRPNQKLQSLIANPHETATAEERGKIVEHIASERFSDESREAASWSRVGFDINGRPHPSRPGETLSDKTMLTSAEWHTVKHAGQGSWANDTTTAEYLADLRAAITHECSLLHVGRERMKPPGVERAPARWNDHRHGAGSIRSFRKMNVLPGHSILSVYDPSRRRLRSSYRVVGTELPLRVGRWENYRTVWSMNISLDQYIDGLERSVRELPAVLAEWDQIDSELQIEYVDQLGVAPSLESRGDAARQ